MAEFKHIQVDVPDEESGYLALTPVVAELVKVVQANPQKGYGLYNLRDYTGQELVVLIRGKVRPGQNDVGRVAVYSLSGETKQTKDGNKVNYSGFYNPKEEIPAQYVGKMPPKPAGEATGGGKGGGGSKGSNRSFALSYAKDLACAGAIKITELPGVTIKFNRYLDTGSFEIIKAPAERKPAQRPAPPVEREIPEMGGFQASPEDNEYAAAHGLVDETGGGFGEGSLDDVPF